MGAAPVIVGKVLELVSRTVDGKQMSEQWTAFLQRMARNSSKPYTGSAKPPRGYQKRMRLAYRKMLTDEIEF